MRGVSNVVVCLSVVVCQLSSCGVARAVICPRRCFTKRRDNEEHTESRDVDGALH